MSPRPVRPGGMRDLRLHRRLLVQARPYWPHLGGILVLGLLSTPLALLTPIPLKIAVDNVIGSRPLPVLLGRVLPAPLEATPEGVLAAAAALFVAVAVARLVQELATSVLRAYVGERLVLRFRSDLFRQAQRLSVTHHDAHGTADAIYRIQYDAPSIQHIAVDGVIPLVTAAVTLAGMIWVTARVDSGLALVALAVAPLLYLALRVCRRRLRKQSHDVKALESGALAVVQEVLSALRVVKACRQEDREKERFVLQSGRGARARVRLAAAEAGFGVLVGMITAVGTATVLYVGVMHVRAGTLTLGELLLVMGYLAQLYDPLKTMAKQVGSLQASLASAERAFSLLDEPPDVPESATSRPLTRASGAVAFRDTSFGYEPGRPVLDRVSFSVEPGTRVGIAGTTGGGKTTLMGLLTRFFDPTGGQVLLDGVDLREYRIGDLRDQFTIVLQEPVLFSTTIAENIAYARPDATRDEIVEAAEAANAHQFVDVLPEGYETVVGERGMSLSGGERQRLSLARAFLKQAPILILDEPTSSLDAATEAGILEAMERLMAGRTSFMITHRLHTLRDCDLVVRLEHGRVSEVADGRDGPRPPHAVALGAAHAPTGTVCA